jgi:hypothetical protein
MRESGKNSIRHIMMYVLYYLDLYSVRDDQN